MSWTDGSKYVGEWKNGIQNGYGKMIFPNGKVKEGYFENNVYKGKDKIETKIEEGEVRLDNKIDAIEQESLWERYGMNRKPIKKNKILSDSGKVSITNWRTNENDGLPTIKNNAVEAYENDNYKYNAMNTTEGTNILTKKANTISQTQISFNRGRLKNSREGGKSKLNSQTRPRMNTAYPDNPPMANKTNNSFQISKFVL